MKLDPNASVFPISDGEYRLGLTKREWMATMICAGMNGVEWAHQTSCDNLASWSVKQADALIAELNKEQ